MFKKLCKICGVKTVEVAQFCEKIGVDFVGLNFVPGSSRYISIEAAKTLRPHFQNTKVVGVFQNQPTVYINDYAKVLNLDYIQLSGDETADNFQELNRPIIKGISAEPLEALPEKLETYLPLADQILIDSAEPGSGQTFSWEDLPELAFPFWLAGGLNLTTLPQALQLNQPNLIGLDIASGAELNGQKDPRKIELLTNLIHNAHS